MPAPPPTRGQRHLQRYLEKSTSGGAKAAARPKTAQDVVPVLRERALASDGAMDGPSSGLTGRRASDSIPSASIHPRVIAHMMRHASSRATNKLSPRQLKLVLALSAASTEAVVKGAGEESYFRVRRAQVQDTADLVDTVAVAALQRAAQVGTPDLTDTSLFLLAENAAAAEAITADLQRRYGLTVLLLADGQERHPAFPVTPKSRGRSPPPPQQRVKSARKGSVTTTPGSAVERAPVAEATEAELSETVVVVVATPEGFLAVDKRSAVWKFVGAYVLALTTEPKRDASALTRRLSGDAATKEGPAAPPLAARLSAHRWDCLGHTTVAAVLSCHERGMAAPELDWLLTLRPTPATPTAAVRASKKGAAGEAAPLKDIPTSAAVGLRREVTVHYAVAEGIHRFGFLFSLIKGLAARSGLVVHLATKEACSFVYQVLYALLDELPRHVRLLTDYEGEGEFAASATSPADRQRLCEEFNETVNGQDGSDSTPDRRACVLLSCYGLVPTRGTIFLAYDVLPDVVNCGAFIADALTPGAYVEATAGNGSHGGLVQRVVRVCKRGRSVSPPPLQARRQVTGKVGRKGEVAGGKDGVQSTNAPSNAGPAMYTHIILLLRRSEVDGALRHLRLQERRYQLQYKPLPQGPSLSSYLLAGEAVRGMHRNVFAIANAAYAAYKATMTAYCTVGPHDVYDAKLVDLQKVCEEFGFTELPLLDLRLKDTAFRPKEDYYKAARQRQLAEQRAYNRFAATNIVGEGPEEHIPGK